MFRTLMFAKHYQLFTNKLSYLVVSPSHVMASLVFAKYTLEPEFGDFR